MPQNEIYILFNGFSELKRNENEEIMLANCTCTLIKAGNINIIVDTLTPWDSLKLIAALKKYHITPKDITFVVSTHGHSDHTGNNNLFLDAEKHIVGKNISNRDTYFLHDWSKSFKITDDIEIISTPGHTNECVSVIVRNTDLDTVAIVGDLFEKEEDVLNDSLWRDAGSFCEDSQKKNRLKIASIADVIVPGHGPAFNVSSEIKKSLQMQVSNKQDSE